MDGISMRVGLSLLRGSSNLKTPWPPPSFCPWRVAAIAAEGDTGADGHGDKPARKKVPSERRLLSSPATCTWATRCWRYSWHHRWAILRISGSTSQTRGKLMPLWVRYRPSRISFHTPGVKSKAIMCIIQADGTSKGGKAIHEHGGGARRIVVRSGLTSRKGAIWDEV